MTKKNRIAYLFCTLFVGLYGFIICGSLGSVFTFLYEDALSAFFICGLIGGLALSAFASTLIVSASFFSKRGTAFKIVASALCPITIVACVYACVFTYIPYQIFNFIKIVTMPNDEE